MAAVVGYAALGEDNLVARYTNTAATVADGSALTAAERLAVREALAMGAIQCYSAIRPGVTTVQGCSREFTPWTAPGQQTKNR